MKMNKIVTKGASFMEAMKCLMESPKDEDIRIFPSEWLHSGYYLSNRDGGIQKYTPDSGFRSTYYLNPLYFFESWTIVREVCTFDFLEAIEKVHNGEKVSRLEWNQLYDDTRWIYLDEESGFILYKDSLGSVSKYAAFPNDMISKDWIIFMQ